MRWSDDDDEIKSSISIYLPRRRTCQKLVDLHAIRADAGSDAHIIAAIPMQRLQPFAARKLQQKVLICMITFVLDCVTRHT